MKNKDKFDADFKDFMTAEVVSPSAEVSAVVSAGVAKDLKISPYMVATKIVCLHSCATLLLIYFCPQFGVSWGNPSTSLMHVFMKFGHLPCAALCGAYLVGGSFLLTTLALKSHESFWLKKQMPALPIGLSLLTLLILMLSGASAHSTELIVWAVFASLGAYGFFVLGRASKLRWLRLAASA